MLAPAGRSRGHATHDRAITLASFARVNFALWWVKRRDPQPLGVFAIPSWVPLVKFVVSAGFVLAAAINLLAK